MKVTISSFRPIPALLLVVTFLAGDTHADTFEFLTYTPPPSGWTKTAVPDGVVYRRASGIGLIYFYSSYAATRPAADEFAAMWRTRIEPTLPAPPPKPQIQRERDYAVAVGGQSVNAQGTLTSISLVTIVARGRAIGVMTMTAGDDALREVTAFLDTMAVAPGSSAALTSGTGGEIAVDFDVPPGYVSERDGRTVVLRPAVINRTTPCVYGISPERPSSGDLEKDARAAILVPLPGWQIKSDHFNAMRGTSGGGWPYYWLRTDVQRLVGASYEYLTAMAMAVPSGQGRVSIVWGFGSTGPCTVDDLTFLRLFFSLRPRGLTSDGGTALARQLHGLWRDTQNAGMAQYRFLPDGRYEYGLGTSTTFGNLETRTGSATDGRWALRGSELRLTGGGRGGSKYRVRVYDEFLGGVWRRAMSLLDESGKPPNEVQYMRIQDSP